MTASNISNWYWTPDLRIVHHVAQPDGISQVGECSDVAYLEAEKKRLSEKRQECVEGASSASKASLKLYFEQLLPEVDYQLEYVNQRLSELTSPTVLTVINSQNNNPVTVSTQFIPTHPPDTVLTVMDESEITVSTQPDNTSQPEAVLTVMDEPEITVSTFLKRRKGQGTGRIQWRTITKKNGKQYKQAWYDWQINEGGKTLSRCTYIPKHLLSKMQRMEEQKAPVREILKLLGV